MKMSMNAFLLSLLASTPVVNGLVVEQGADLLAMVSSFLGDAESQGLISVEDIQFTGDPRCRGIFIGGAVAVPNGDFPDEGFVLSSGQPGSLHMQNTGGVSFCYNRPGDPYLSGVVGTNTRDACALEIAFKVSDPRSNPFMSFQYVFGSDEYTEYSNSEFNDAFALLLNGNNIAMVPGTNDVVSINSINQLNMNQYFHNNDIDVLDSVPYPLFEADGFTDNLMAIGEVIPDPDAVNILKLVIADTSDCQFDSWVLLTKGSFRVLPGPAVEMDPHIKTWGGETFDYMGECDMTLLQNPAFKNGHGLYIDIRTTIRYEYSFIESAVLQIGEDKLEVSGYGLFALNEVVDGRLHHGDAYLSGHRLHYSELSVNQTKFDVVLSPETNITIMTYKDFVNVKIVGGKKILGNSLGLMGSSLTGDMMSRDGKRMDASSQEHIDAWGQEWQVTADSPMRFMEPRSPQASKGEKCIVPEVTAKQSLRRRLLGSEISLEEARSACAGLSGVSLDACVGDVLALQDLGVAKAGAY